ncbi:hypothetical protein CHLRE_02g141126v5 [Chlamydomonas reinhardtii]|uniref:Uncharacterized protein n=1 Tax=Chlamydomonas reinhardtii TaxID=3055 RepID=A0A2K3E466_CHLRE|nr:uncharacterized protein CHLRE_02g141126v5 [Chlamydomonas reinhardtii]PNW87584.1 hypothetical protein CHLRE_02g141126v5 [Chlamydomonas reinhardtii]
MKRGPHVGHVLSRVARAQDGRQLLAIIIQVVGKLRISVGAVISRRVDQVLDYTFPG